MTTSLYFFNFIKMEHSSKILGMYNGHIESAETAKLKPVDDGKHQSH